MRMFMLSIFVVAVVPQFSFAKGSPKGSKGNGLFWVGVAGGNRAAETPQDNFDTELVGAFSGGAEYRVLGPMYINFSVFYYASTGYLKYDYTDEALVQYQDDRVGFTRDETFLTLGLSLRLIDAKYFHIYAGGGGHMGVGELRYATETSSAITGAGNTYLKSEKDIYSFGKYAEGGIDVLIGDVGLRLGVRVSESATTRVKAIDNQKIKSKEGLAFIGVLRNF